MGKTKGVKMRITRWFKKLIVRSIPYDQTITYLTNEQTESVVVSYFVKSEIVAKVSRKMEDSFLHGLSELADLQKGKPSAHSIIIDDFINMDKEFNDMEKRVEAKLKKKGCSKYPLNDKPDFPKPADPTEQ